MAKGGVSAATKAKIEQHFAKSGEVKGYSGADASPVDQVVQPDAMGMAEPPVPEVPLPAGAQPQAEQRNPLLSMIIPNRSTLSGLGQDINGALDHAAASIMGAKPTEAPAGVAKEAPPGTQEQAGAVSTPGAAPAPKEQPIKLPSGPNVEAQYAKGTEEAKAGEAAKAAAMEGLGKTQQDILAKGQAAKDLSVQAIDKEWKDNEAASKGLADNIAAFKVDPDAWWSHQSTPAKIRMSIGMILGGIGAGMTHSENPVLQMMQKHIENDVDAQKTKLGAMHTQLQAYTQRGHSLQAARQLVIADSLDRVRGQLEAASAGASGPLAKAAAQAAMGALDQKASQERMAAYTNRLENQQRALAIHEGLTNIAAQKQTLAIMNKLTSGEGFDRRVLELPSFKEYRERQVILPDGTVGFAKDTQSATKAQEQHSAIDDLSKPLEEYNGLFKNGHPTISPTDRGRAEALRSRIVAALGNMRDAGALKGAEYSERLAEVPDATDILTTKASGKLKELGRLVDDKRSTVNASLVTRKSGAAPSGVRF